MSEDAELLRRYATEHSEAAFTELIRRHVDLVYSAALRLVNGDVHRAEDVTQQVFAEFARQARNLARHPAPTGWLYTTTRLIALHTIRTERRRTTREREAHTMNELLRPPDPETDWNQLRPVLEDAMHELGEHDRHAVLLRFFQNKNHKEVGAALGLGENAARMRVDRALDKLRDHLARRGITTTAGALSLVLSANAVQAAPAGLTAAISTATLAGTSLAVTATTTAAKALAMTALQKTLVAATVALLVGAGIYEARQIAPLRKQNQGLQQQQAQLAEHIQELQRERDEATNQLARVRADNERLDPNTSEVLRLRAEMGKLQARIRELEDQAGEHSVGDAGKQPEQIVVVVGEVNAPGPKAWSDSMKLTDALSMAKGATSFAAKKVTIKDAGGNSKEYNLDEVAGGQAEDPLLKPGDTVYVPRSGVPSTPADSGSAAK